MPSKAKIILKEELIKMHTGSLMARRKKLLQCEEIFYGSDRWHDGEKEPDPKDTGYIEFKATKEWQKAYKELKEVLATREHWTR